MLKLLGTGLSLDEIGTRYRPLAPVGCRVAQLSVPRLWMHHQLRLRRMTGLGNLGQQLKISSNTHGC